MSTCNKTQAFLGEIFPDYKDSESYMSELLVERIRVLEKKDQENQKVMETMMNTLETLMSTIEKREKELKEEFKATQLKASLSLNLLNGFIKTLDNVADYIWKHDKDTLIQLYIEDTTTICSSTEILKYIFIESSKEDLEYFINKGGELYFNKFYSDYKGQDKHQYGKIKFLVSFSWHLQVRIIQADNLYGKKCEEYQNIILSKFKRVFDSINIEEDKWSLFSTNTDVAIFVKNLRLAETYVDFKVGSKIFYKKRKIYGKIIEIDQTTNSYTIKLENGSIIDTISANIEMIS